MSLHEPYSRRGSYIIDRHRCKIKNPFFIFIFIFGMVQSLNWRMVWAITSSAHNIDCFPSLSLQWVHLTNAMNDFEVKVDMQKGTLRFGGKIDSVLYRAYFLSPCTFYIRTKSVKDAIKLSFCFIINLGSWSNAHVVEYCCALHQLRCEAFDNKDCT